MNAHKFLISLIGVLLCMLSLPAPIVTADEDSPSVHGYIRMLKGKYVFADVYFLEVTNDKYFSHWAGSNGGTHYIFDPLTSIWYPSPVTYEATKILFRGELLEGFIRIWGYKEQQQGRYVPAQKVGKIYIPARYEPGYTLDWTYKDIWYFFGFDGMVYKFKKTDAQGNPIKKGYYVNMSTGEQSIWEPRTAEETERYEKLKAEMTVDGKPTFASWQARPDRLPPSIVPKQDAAKGADTEK